MGKVLEKTLHRDIGLRKAELDDYFHHLYIKIDNIFNKNVDIKVLGDLFEKIIPIHPYSVLIIAEIFSKYFQNQR
jgi:hypothetical protein